MSIHSKHFIDRAVAARLQLNLSLALSLILSVPLGICQQTAKENVGGPKYDSKTEFKGKGVVDDIKLLTFGSRKDFVELMVKNGDGEIPAYICPKPFEDEMGITFSKGDEVSFTGSKVKQEEADIVLIREMVKGTDTLMFRDDKGAPIWDWHTGK